jgi:hypothetical protein
MQGHDEIGGAQTNMNEMRQSMRMAQSKAQSMEDRILDKSGLNSVDLQGEFVAPEAEAAAAKAAKKQGASSSGDANDDEKDDGNDAANAKTTSGASSKKKGKQASVPYWNAQEAISGASSSWHTLCMDLRENCEKAVEGILVILQESRDLMSPESADPLAKIVGWPLRLARNRYNAMERVLLTYDTSSAEMKKASEDAVAEYCAAVKHQKEIVDALSDDKDPERFTPSAPIEQYLNLVNFQAMRDEHNDALENASSKRQMEELKSRVGSKKSAIESLVAAMNKSLKEIGKALDSRAKATKGAKARSSMGSEKTSTGGPRVSIHDFGADVAEPVPSCADPMSRHHYEMMNLSHPYLITNTRFMKDLACAMCTVAISRLNLKDCPVPTTDDLMPNTSASDSDTP